MSRANLARAAVLLIGLVVLTGCRQKMADQPRYDPLEPSAFFPNGQSARPLPPNTVPRGQLRADSLLYTGKENGADATTFPFTVTLEVLQRGQERFNIYCAPCHDRAGTGHGIVVQRGFMPPPSFHSDRLRTAPVGHFFDVITNGFGVMPDYRAQIAPRDRWAIVAYIRALQYSQHAPASDVPGGDPTKVPQQPGSGASEPGKH